MPSLITLTTDFGQREPFVAEIKGILYRECPGVQVIDLGHDIGRGDVMEAALFVQRAIPNFPAGTVHLVNVAPGPEPIAVSVLGQSVVCPDNGVLTLLSQHHALEAVHTVTRPAGGQGAPGQIYFGRDVFAPAVASLANGAALGELGPARDEPNRLAVPRPERVSAGMLTGKIIHVDRFGNLVTNVHSEDLAGCTIHSIEAGGFPLGPLRYSYAEVPQGSPLALMGSGGYLEVAYNGDRADRRLDFGPGINVRITLS